MANDPTTVEDESAPPVDGRVNYIKDLNVKIEPNKKITRTPDRSFVETTYSVEDVVATGPLNWSQAININTAGIHTSGRRDNIEEVLSDGISPFGTPVNETLAETPAVVYGYLKDRDTIQDSETFMRDYGGIFNNDTEGFIVVLDPEVKNTEGYEIVGPEARLKTKVLPKDIKAIIVGTQRMQKKVTEEAKKKGVVFPVIRMSKTDQNLN